MMFKVELIHTSPNANPKRATATIEAKDERALRAAVARIAAEEMPKRPRERSFRPGWTSYRDDAKWGLAEGIEIVSAEAV